MNHAEKTKTGHGEILRQVWCAVGSQAVWNNIGGQDAIPFASILLLAVCQLAGREKPVFKLSASDFSELQKNTLRIVWKDAEGLQTTARSPQEFGLERSSPRESANTLRGLPFGPSQSEATEAVLILRSTIKEARDVPKAFSTVEEIWRSFLNESENLKRIGIGEAIIKSTRGFPLSERNVPARSHILRGAGNAIVPQVAALFIQAAEESIAV